MKSVFNIKLVSMLTVLFSLLGTTNTFAQGSGTVEDMDITIPYTHLLLDKIELGDKPIKVV